MTWSQPQSSTYRLAARYVVIVKEKTLRRYLREALNVTPAQWKELVELGLPRKKDGTYDHRDVCQWLEDQGLVEPIATSSADNDKEDDVVCTRPEDAAGYFGVSHTTIRNWQQDKTCPAKPGFYPIQAMRVWRDGQNPAHRPGRVISDEERRFKAAKAELAEMDLAKSRGELVPLQGMLDLIRRSTARHKAILYAFPDRLAKGLKELGLEKDQIEFARTACLEMIDDLCLQIARDLLDQQAEEDMAVDDRAGEV